MKSWIREATSVSHLEARCGEADIFEWLEAQAESLSVLGASPTGAVGFSSHRLRSALKIADISPGAVTARAELQSDGREFLVTFNPLYSFAARRFAIAHECGHALLHRLTRSDSSSSAPRVERGDRAIEALCDYFAAALLVPRQSLKRFVDADPMSGLRPPLHLVPEVARRFAVQERIAAWRLLLVCHLSDWVAVRVRRIQERPLLREEIDVSDSWETVWYVKGECTRKQDVVKGYSVPFGRHRKIPVDMLPPESTCGTLPVQLDSRWVDGARPQPLKDASRPMRMRTSGPQKAGYAASRGDSIYIAVREAES